MSEWDYTNNYLLCNPDNILDSYNKKVWWICNDCGHRYLMSPKRRLLLQKRKVKACPYEKGYRRKKTLLLSVIILSKTSKSPLL